MCSLEARETASHPQETIALPQHRGEGVWTGERAGQSLKSVLEVLKLMPSSDSDV